VPRFCGSGRDRCCRSIGPFGLWGGSGKVAVPATASPVTAGSSVASSAAVGVVAIGHSGLTGENSDPARPAHSDAPENSWATGTSPQVNSVYTRLAAIRPETKGHVANTAQGGAKAESLAAQARAALLKVPTPALVIIQTIDNDIRCDGTDASHVGEFGTQVADALNVITTASPRSQILIVGQLGRPSPTFIEKLVVKVPAVKADLTTGDACAFYDSTGALVTSNFATLTTIIDSYEAEQTRQCSAVPNCATDGGTRARYVDTVENFSPDWAHLNAKGNAAAAALIWPRVTALLKLT